MSYGNYSYGLSPYGDAVYEEETDITVVPLEDAVIEAVVESYSTTGGLFYIVFDPIVLECTTQYYDILGGAVFDVEPFIELECGIEVDTGAVTYGHNAEPSINMYLGIEVDNSVEDISLAQPWWDNNWPFRRKLEITAPPTGLENGSPITVYIDTYNIRQQKIRSDLEDIYAVKLVSEEFGTWDPLAMQKEVVDGQIKVRFNLTEALDANESIDSVYYIYYGNRNLVGQPPHEEYVYQEYPVQETWADGVITFTRPGEDWIENVSQRKNAKASLDFWGDSIQVICDKGPDYGIAEIQLDNLEWELIDLFNSTLLLDQAVWSADELSYGEHTLRIRQSGSKHPSSTSFSINIIEMKYKKHGLAVNLKEESNDAFRWASVVGGVLGG